MKIYLAILFSMFFVFQSCEKTKNESNIDILQSKDWKFGIFDKNVATNPTGNYTYYPVSECEKDDLYTFSSGMHLNINYGNQRCSNNQLDSKEVEYSYNQDTNTLTIDGIEYKVLEITKSQIKYYAILPPVTDYEGIIFMLQ